MAHSTPNCQAFFCAIVTSPGVVDFINRSNNTSRAFGIHSLEPCTVC